MNSEILERVIELTTKLKQDESSLTIDEVKELRRITPALSEHCSDLVYQMEEGK